MPEAIGHRVMRSLRGFIPLRTRATMWASILLLIGLGADASAAQQSIPAVPEPAELALRHREWIEEKVVYIITPIEKEAFLLLGSDALRDAFVEAFWRTRDPTPGTVTNEARDGYEERLAYAARYLGAETPRPGWRTDRGRTYIQLGPPSDKLTYHDPGAFYPIELWFYRTDPGPTGLPPFFWVMFFRPFQTGEYRMYDPVTDGPAALTSEFMLAEAPAAQIVDRLLFGIGHEVAMASVNLIPTDFTDLRNPRPSIRNAQLFASIEEAPLKGINVEYAHRFVANRGEVEATVVYETLPLQIAAAAFWDERGMPYLHYGVQVPAQRVLLGQFEDDYYLSLRLEVDVRDARGETIIFGGDDIQQSFEKDRADQIIRAPLAYYDRMDLVPGLYDLSVTLRNKVTDDASLAVARVSVPFAGDDRVALSDLLVASAVYPLSPAEASEEPRAFRFGREQFIPVLKGGRLPQGGTAELFMQMVATPDLELTTTVRVSATLIDAEGAEVMTLVGIPTSIMRAPAPTPLRVTIPLDTVAEGFYDVVVMAELSNGQRLVREEKLEVVKPALAVRPEVLLAREVRATGLEEYQLRGGQHVRKGELAAAGAYFGVALDRDGNNIAFRRALAGIQVTLGLYAEAIELLRPLVASPAALHLDSLLLSEALRETGSPAEAARLARSVLANGRPTPGAYNALADALVDLGRTTDAIAAYEASLVLDKDQPAVREKLTRLKGDTRARHW